MWTRQMWIVVKKNELYCMRAECTVQTLNDISFCWESRLYILSFLAIASVFFLLLIRLVSDGNLLIYLFYRTYTLLWNGRMFLLLGSNLRIIWKIINKICLCKKAKDVNCVYVYMRNDIVNWLRDVHIEQWELNMIFFSSNLRQERNLVLCVH